MKSTIAKILTIALAVSVTACMAAGCNGNKSNDNNNSSSASQTSQSISAAESKSESKAESTAESKAESTVESKAESTVESRTESTEGSTAITEESKEGTPQESAEENPVIPDDDIDVANITADQIESVAGGADAAETYEILIADLPGERSVICLSSADGSNVSMIFGLVSQGTPVDNGDGTSTVTQTVTSAEGEQTVVSATFNAADTSSYVVTLDGTNIVFQVKTIEDKDAAAIAIRAAAAKAAGKTEAPVDDEDDSEESAEDAGFELDGDEEDADDDE